MPSAAGIIIFHARSFAGAPSVPLNSNAHAIKLCSDDQAADDYAVRGGTEDDIMFVAMNRFRIAPGKEEEFEAIWKDRTTNLPSLPGFVAFHLLRGPTTEESTLFASHTVWASRQHFEDWTKSEAFRQSHSGAGRSTGMYLGPPQLELFESVHEVLG